MKKHSMRFATKVATAMAIAGATISTMGMTVMAAENTVPVAVETPAETQPQADAPNYKPTFDDNRARWIYYEMNEGFGEPEEVTPKKTEVQEAPEVPTTTAEKELKVIYLPGDDELKEMNLYDLVRNKEIGWSDSYYDTYRGNGEWKHVGSGDMIKFVRRTLGEDDPRYQALEKYCTTRREVHHPRR